MNFKGFLWSVLAVIVGIVLIDGWRNYWRTGSVMPGATPTPTPAPTPTGTTVSTDGADATNAARMAMR